MFPSINRKLSAFITLLCLMLICPAELSAFPEPTAQSASGKKNNRNSKTGRTRSGGKSSSSGSSAKGKGSGNKNAAPKGKSTSKQTQKAGTKGKANATTQKGNKKGRPETSADVKKRHEETRREIQRTKEELQRNEAEMKKSLGDLGRINADLEKTRGEVAVLKGDVGKLDSKIASLSGQISENEAKLEKLRAEYLKAVKKMRTARGNKSALAFIFSSDSFNQAMRRMRYMRRFSEWKDKQSEEIGRRVSKLNDQKRELAKARNLKDDALRREQLASAELEKKGREQDAVVADLKRNGDLLNAHLSKKQQEANALKSRIAALIAEEERKAAAERAEAERRAAEKRAAEQAAREREAREKAEAERRLAEQKERELALAETPKEDQSRKKEQSKPKKESAKEQPKKETAPKQDKKKDSKAGKSDEGRNYADARKRKPRDRNDASKASNTTKETASANVSKATSTPKSSADNGFASMRGALPRPVDGSWRVTSRFGRQELPDLPGVVYDNPGINVEVPIGATVKSVYSGKISGVYMVPGYQTVIIVNHGNYYTAYGNLKSPAVKVGDQVKAGQKLGSAAENMDDPGHGELHFEVYRNRDKLNPLEWIR